MVPPHSAASQAACEEDGRRLEDGDIRVDRINTDTFKAGHIQIVKFVQARRLRQEWRAVCADGWDEHDALVACRQLFQGSGMKFFTADNVLVTSNFKAMQ